MTYADMLFEAFFWIEPGRPNINSPFQSKKVIWHYPDDVSNVIKAYRDIPQFCFPDMEKTRLEKAESIRSEHFTFTLTDGDGKRVYGICLRTLFRGEKGRHDVSRRPRHCLCFITRHPYFSLFKTMLLQIYALSLLEPHPGRARLYLDVIHKQTLPHFSSPSSLTSGAIHICVSAATFPLISRDLTLSTIRYSGMRVSNREVAILPLLELLGVDRFMLLLSAVMSERRIMFVADEVDRLSSAVLATASMLHPFHWHHFFIPLLPSKLLDYASAPFPYIIGVRRYLLPKLNTDALGDVLIVDADTGDFKPLGNVQITDFVGESGTALKQATDGLDRVIAKASIMANLFLGNDVGNSNSGDSTSSGANGSRDIVSSVLSEIKSIINSKPGSNASLQSVASGLLRTLPGGGKPIEELKMHWTIEGEKSLRDSLTIFFVHLFFCLEDFVYEHCIDESSSFGGKTSGSRSFSRGEIAKAGDAFGEGDSRAAFDLNAFMTKRSQMGDSKALLQFISEFMHSQMFERFCDELLSKIRSNRKPGSTKQYVKFKATSESTIAPNVMADDEDDIYEVSCAELKQRGTNISFSVVKQIVAARSLAGSSKDEKVGSEFHQLTLQLTAGAIGDASAASLYAQLVDRVSCEAFHSSTFLKIMRTVAMRLETCRASGSRGSSGHAGVRALQLLKHLLLQGPEAVLSYALDFIPTIRSLIQSHLNSRSSAATAVQQSAAQALEFMSQGAAVDVRPSALLVLSLLLDHAKLILQRRCYFMSHRGSFPYSAITSPGVDSGLEVNRRDWLVGNDVGLDKPRKFPRFEDMHLRNQPPGCIQTNAETVMSTHSSSNTYFFSDQNAFKKNSTHFDDPQPVQSVEPLPTSVDLLDLGGNNNHSGVILDDAKFRIVNKDTGEVLDLRDLDKVSLSKQTDVISNYGMKPKAYVPILSPPPPPASYGLSKPSKTSTNASDDSKGSINDFVSSIPVSSTPSPASISIFNSTSQSSAGWDNFGSPANLSHNAFPSSAAFAPTISAANGPFGASTFVPSQSIRPQNPFSTVPQMAPCARPSSTFIVREIQSSTAHHQASPAFVKSNYGVGPATRAQGMAAPQDPFSDLVQGLNKNSGRS